MFSKNLINGEIVKRGWLVYSASTGWAFCALCQLYGGKTLLATSGFGDCSVIFDHDNCSEHWECLAKYAVSAKFSSTCCGSRKVLRMNGLPIHGEN